MKTKKQPGSVLLNYNHTNTFSQISLRFCGVFGLSFDSLHGYILSLCYLTSYLLIPLYLGHVVMNRINLSQSSLDFEGAFLVSTFYLLRNQP